MLLLPLAAAAQSAPLPIVTPGEVLGNDQPAHCRKVPDTAGTPAVPPSIHPLNQEPSGRALKAVYHTVNGCSVPITASTKLR